MAQSKIKETLPEKKARMLSVLKDLKRVYPDAECSLTHENPFQLLVSTVLSAQCTDERVNRVTPALFKKFPTPKAMALASLPELEELIRSTGFYKSKAKSLLHLSQALIEQHQGKVPESMEALTALRGVGRKTANVVLGNAFGVPGLVVDTHVGRLSRRLGFTRAQDPVKVEHEIMVLVPKEDWTLYSHLLISHGRAVCMARNPQCEICPISKKCPKVGVR